MTETISHCLTSHRNNVSYKTDILIISETRPEISFLFSLDVELCLVEEVVVTLTCVHNFDAHSVHKTSVLLKKKLLWFFTWSSKIIDDHSSLIFHVQDQTSSCFWYNFLQMQCSFGMHNTCESFWQNENSRCKTNYGLFWKELIKNSHSEKKKSTFLPKMTWYWRFHRLTPTLESNTHIFDCLPFSMLHMGYFP